MFDWHKIFSIQLKSPQDRADVSRALDRIAATPAGQAMMEEADKNAVASLRGALARTDRTIAQIAPAWTTRPKPIVADTGEQCARKAVAGPPAPTSDMRNMEQQRSRLVERIGDGDPSRSGHILIVDGAENGFAPKGQKILYAGDAGHIEEYLGVDGKFHPASPVRALAHEIGHGAQGSAVYSPALRAHQEASSQCGHTVHERPSPQAGEKTRVPHGDAAAERPGLPTHPPSACDRSLGAFRAIIVNTVEQPNVDQHENPVMRQVDPAQVDRGDYRGWRHDGVAQFAELGDLPSPSTPRGHQAPLDKTNAR